MRDHLRPGEMGRGMAGPDRVRYGKDFLYRRYRHAGAGGIGLGEKLCMQTWDLEI